MKKSLGKQLLAVLADERDGDAIGLVLPYSVLRVLNPEP